MVNPSLVRSTPYTRKRPDAVAKRKGKTGTNDQLLAKTPVAGCRPRWMSSPHLLQWDRLGECHYEEKLAQQGQLLPKTRELGLFRPQGTSGFDGLIRGVQLH